MQDKSNISIFQGSTVEADTVHDFLAQQGIGSLVRNHMQETLDAGWVTADAEHAAEVFVALDDEKRAVDLLNNLYSEDAALPGPGAEATTGGAVIITSEPSADRLNDNRTSAEKPLDLPRIIAVPTVENRPPVNAPTAANPSTSERSATTNPDTPPGTSY